MTVGIFGVLVAAAMALTGCNRSHTAGTGKRFVPANDPAIRYEGRWDRSNEVCPKASWPGFGLSTVVNGGSIEVRMRDPGNFYNVEVDGKWQGVVGGRRGSSITYPLASGLPPGPHLVRLQRRNISFEEPTELEGFVVDEGVVLSTPPPLPGPAIEFIGDSFTAAEGDEATTPTLGWKEKYSVTNFDLGFAARISRHYRGELTAVCRSGSGLVADYMGNRNGQMEERYDRALMETAEPKWPFPEPSAGLVLICLGLNDDSGLRGPDGKVGAANVATFEAAYHHLIATVRGRHPHAKIVAIAPWLPWLRETIARVVRDEQAAGPTEVGYAQFDELPGTYVADGHPTVETHRRIAEQIIPQLPAIDSLKTR